MHGSFSTRRARARKSTENKNGASWLRRLPEALFIAAVAAEYSRAAAAAHRYEQLKRMARARDDPVADTARRIYMEFYSDG